MSFMNQFVNLVIGVLLIAGNIGIGMFIITALRGGVDSMTEPHAMNHFASVRRLYGSNFPTRITAMVIMIGLPVLLYSIGMVFAGATYVMYVALHLVSAVIALRKPVKPV